MSTLPELRALLVTTIKDHDEGLVVHDHLPPQIHPPVVLIEPADPYIADAPEQGYGSHAVSFDLHIITRRGTGQVQTAELDDLIQRVIDATDPAFELGEVARPYRLQVGSTSYLASRVTVSTPNRF